MLGLLAAWLLYPAVALLVCAGLGALVERAAGGRLPGVLLLPVGMAGLIGLTQLTTYRDETAELTIPLVVVTAVAGLWLGRGRLRGRTPDVAAAAAAAGVFAVLSAPVVLSGTATFAGYTILGDTSIHFIGADSLLTLGREFGGLPESSYEYSLFAYYGANAYPSGGPTAAAVLTSLVGQDVAWTFQPFLSLLVALTALALYSLIAPHVASARWRAAVAFLAAQPALVLAYALQGSVKEIGTAFGVVLAGALIPDYLRRASGGPRTAVPLAVATGATVAVVGPAAAVWLGPLLLGTLLAARLAWRVRLVHVAAFLAVAGVLSFQMILDVLSYVEVTGGVVTAQAEFGNLLGPLSPWQKFGVWLTGDYRVPPERLYVTLALIGAVIVGCAFGVIGLVRRRAWGVGFFVAVSVLAHFYVVRKGSPWADGKALMIVSPVIVLTACLGAAFLRRAEGVVLVALIAVGVLWSNALAYHDVSLAPRDRLEELQAVGERIRGEGPTLYPEFEEFAKHFLRDGAPEGPGEGWQRRFLLTNGRDGAFARFGFAADLDRFTEEYVLHYRTIVLRRGFQSSRPPAPYVRTYAGDAYEVWQRPAGPPPSLTHLPVGDDRSPAAVPDCEAVRALAARGGTLAYVERPPNVLFKPAAVNPLPPGWFVDQADAETIVLRGAGEITGTVEVARAGRYDLWVEGSDQRVWKVLVDGERRLTGLGELNTRGVATRAGTLELPAGTHTITLSRPGGSLSPGSGGHARLLGPVALTPADVGSLPVKELPATRWRRLCGRSLDWAEALSSG